MYFAAGGEVLSDLKSTLFKETDETVNTVPVDISGLDDTQPSVDESYSPDINITDELPVPEKTHIPETTAKTEEHPAEKPEDVIRESSDAVRRMKEEIAAENESLNIRFAERAGAVQVQMPQRRRPVYVIGVLSAAASLIFMGIALAISLIKSPIGAYAAIKLSPVMLIFLGAEILYAVFRKHSLRIKVDIRSVIIITMLIALSSVLSVVSVTASAGTGERIYAEKRLQNMLASELHDTIAKDYIKCVDIETQLFGEDAEMYATPADLNDGDIINITVHFADAQMTIREFAKDCKDILDDMHKLSYNFGNIDFIADDRINRYVLNVDWHYQSDFSSDKLAGFVNYFGDDISDTDIPDITDEE